MWERKKMKVKKVQRISEVSHNVIFIGVVPNLKWINDNVISSTT